MCGIAGVVRTGKTSAVDFGAVRRAMSALAHRGPDDFGIYEGQHAVLGHRRLSILDLSAAGHQPMENEKRTLRVVFNGEIYNYQDLHSQLAAAGHTFRSRTDTEVLLHGYEEWGGRGLLERLRGMFAFGIYDQTREGRTPRLFLARDRLGIKPLYYHAGSDFIVFASEVKALVSTALPPREEDRKALVGFLIAGAVPAPRTIIKGISSLPAGHWAEWEQGDLRIQKYWDLECPPEQSADVKPLESTLDDAVQLHLVSDVPLGVFLSGGVDSAGLVALASKARRNRGESLSTLTVIFDENDYSEAGPAAAIARHFDTSHQEVRVTSADFKRALPRFLAAMDQPTNDGINSWFVSKAASEAGLKVVLSGLGGDEVFWGYKHHRWMRRAAWATACPGPLRRVLAAAGSGWGRVCGRDNWSRTAWLGRASSNGRMYLTMRGFFAPGQAARLLDADQKEMDLAYEEHFGALDAGGSLSATGVNYVEMKRYLHDQLLRDTDVFSMAHSIEARVPYLDHVLVEKLWRTAPESKLHGAFNKPLLVDAIGQDAVREAAARPKLGFTFPMARWMNTCAPELREMAEHGSLGRTAVRECWSAFSEGRQHWSRAWALTVLGGMAA
jgi:asparagine synthase (glutamine-hydrolysing)